MNATPITAGMTLKARSLCDYECIFECEVLARKGNFATVKVAGSSEPKRCKIHTWNGEELIYAMGRYSMAPAFKVWKNN